jgi:hypothetical protein
MPDLVGSVTERSPPRSVCSSMENQSDRHVGWIDDTSMDLAVQALQGPASVTLSQAANWGCSSEGREPVGSTFRRTERYDGSMVYTPVF